MKLRNKKTGEIKEYYSVAIFENCFGDGIGEYKTIEELNEEWEEYKPTEPLIKNKQIRKAVRAWADANGVERVFIGNNNRELVAKFREGQSISFGSSLLLDRGRNYTITELCGEEE